MRRLIHAAVLSGCTAAATAAVTAAPAAAPPPFDADQAAAQIMHARNLAQHVDRPGASDRQLRQDLVELDRLRLLLDQPPYRDIASGNPRLVAERINLGFALAETRARLGDKDGALRALESTTRLMLMPQMAAFCEHDPNLASLKDEPRFQAVLALHRRGAIISSKGFASPYTDKLTLEQRIAGLSLFWSEVRHNFANVDLAPQLDWDAVYLDYLAKVEHAETTADYYAILMQLAPLLHDGHTNIYAPPQLQSRFYASTPLETALVEDAVVVVKVHDDGLAGRVHPGDRIVAIDGVDVKTYAEGRVRPYVSSSTEQDRDVRMYGYQLLQGDARTPAALTLADAQGHAYTLSVPRSGGKDGAGERFAFRMLPSGVAYLRLGEFETDGGIKAFQAAWPQIRTAKGLILDVRANGGGSTNFGTAILAHLSDKPVAYTSSRVRFEEQTGRAQSGDLVSWQPLPAEAPLAPAPADQVFKGPVALLIGPRTFSAAEDFSAMFAQARRGALVGEATAGSTGQPLMLNLPGGGMARICVKRDSYVDGSDFVGSGVRPTLEVKPTIAALRGGQDPALKAADDLLVAHPEPYASAD